MRGPAALALAVGMVALASAQQGTTPPPVPPTTTPPTTAPPTTTPPGGAKPAGTTVPARGSTSPRPLAATAGIAGRVLDSSGRPVPRAIVRVTGQFTARTTVADARGNFAFAGLTPDDVVIRAEKFGLIAGGFGQRRPAGLPLTLSLMPTQVIDDMRIELFRHAVITGIVVDEGRAPVTGARVVALRRVFANGEWNFREVASDETDDEGRYRLWGLEPGEYVVVAPSAQVTLPPDSDVAISAGGALSYKTSVDAIEGVYPTYFYPATTHAALALPVHLTPGDVRLAVDFLIAPTEARRVSGRLTSTLALGDRYEMRLVDLDGIPRTGHDASYTWSRRDGTFAFDGVPPGRYRIEVSDANPRPQAPAAEPDPADPADAAPMPPPVRLFGRLDVFVGDEDATDLVVRLQATTEISGRVSIQPEDGSGQSDPKRRPDVFIEPAEPGASAPRQAAYDESGTFRAGGLVPGRYWIRVVTRDRSVHLKAIAANGASALDAPIDVGADGTIVVIELTTKPTEILGTVRDATLKAIAGATVIAMPVPRRPDAVWLPNRMFETRASTTGVFTIVGLPPGEYLLVAIDDAVAEGWQDPAVLATLRTLATRVNLRDAQSLTLQLRFSHLRR